jgi:hypothetical protein
VLEVGTNATNMAALKDNITLQSGALHILVFRRIAKGRAVGFASYGPMPSCVFIGAENHELPNLTPEQAKSDFLHTCAHEVGHKLTLSYARFTVEPYANDSTKMVGTPHDGGIDPIQYNMKSLMVPQYEPKHPEHTWIRHEDLRPAWNEARFSALP